MTPDSGGIRFGDERIVPVGSDGRTGPLSRRPTAILESDASLALSLALAVRSSGGLPVVGDDRWPADLRSAFVRQLDDVEVPSEAAWATFTSGSTGRPRTVLRTAESWECSFSAVSSLVGLRDDDVVYAPAPLVSSLSLFAAVHAIAAGVDVRLPRGHTLAVADLEDSTVLHSTPYALSLALDAIESGAPHRLRVAIVGGDRVAAALRARAEAVGVQVIGYYGAAELSFVAVDVGDGLRAFPGVELQLRDGAVWVHSSYCAIGYLPGQSGPLVMEADGWATVGDRATRQADGTILIGARADGAILTAGATVVPSDVESALGELVGVRDIAVFGIDYPRAGSIVAAVVEGASPPELGALREVAAARLALAQRPRRWYWLRELPRTASGKVDRDAVSSAVLRGEAVRL